MTMTNDCLFCRIVANEIPSTRVYEDERVVAFRDINPQAPTHVLIVPKRHSTSVLELADDPEAGLIMAAVLKAAQTIAASEGLTERGFRLVACTGPDGGQTVFHTHFHVLGGRAFHD